jgi:hypothetical protein
MYIRFPMKSEFLAPLLAGIKASKGELQDRRVIAIHLKKGGYKGTWTVVLRSEDQNGFEVVGSIRDESRFPQRIRVAAWALQQLRVSGTFEISHDASGLLTVRNAASEPGSRQRGGDLDRSSFPSGKSGSDASFIQRLVRAVIRAAEPGGLTRKYFESARDWEAPVRERFFKMNRSVATSRVGAESEATALVEELGTRYKAIWPDTKLQLRVFYSGIHEAINLRGWWKGPAPSLFGSTEAEASEIAGVVKDALRFFVSHGDDRNYSLLTKWCHFTFADTFAIFDGNAARSIQTVMAVGSNGAPESEASQFLVDRIGNTNGAGYIGLLKFYRLLHNAAESAGLLPDLERVTDETQALLRHLPGCSNARVSSLDIVDKLLWKANGSATLLGLGEG